MEAFLGRLVAEVPAAALQLRDLPVSGQGCAVAKARESAQGLRELDAGRLPDRGGRGFATETSARSSSTRLEQICENAGLRFQTGCRRAGLADRDQDRHRRARSVVLRRLVGSARGLSARIGESSGSTRSPWLRRDPGRHLGGVGTSPFSTTDTSGRDWPRCRPPPISVNTSTRPATGFRASRCSAMRSARRSREGHRARRQARRRRHVVRGGRPPHAAVTPAQIPRDSPFGPGFAIESRTRRR